ncbi:MAG: hypothetical protein E6J91_06345 [Deltaproteobacteria bacterium]|nr:MAG: hypothetical protein E6J91_06345 [Deltaproteobacteria bacterium]
MEAAEQLPLEKTEPLPWVEICKRYPDQYVCLVDIDRAELRSPEIKTARVVGHGPTRRAAFNAIRDLSAKYSRHAVRFTGICTEPLIRPSLLIDDETLEFLRS